MEVTTGICSEGFVSAASSGQDWREAVKGILSQLDAACKGNTRKYTIGFLYVSDVLQSDVSSVLNLLRSVTGVERWVGGTGIGVCAYDREFFDEPAISVMMGNIPEDQFRLFRLNEMNEICGDPDLNEWLDENETMLTVAHIDPEHGKDPVAAIENIQNKTGGFLTGGISSLRTQETHLPAQAEGRFSGIVLSSEVPVSTALSQGCNTDTPVHVITRTEENGNIMELDNQKAMEVFTRDIEDLITEKARSLADNKDTRAEEGSRDIPEECWYPFLGQVHAAFPVLGSDQNDFTVRNIVEIDSDFGHLRVASEVSCGDRMFFVHRDAESLRYDMSRTLVELRKRVTAERGCFAPQAALLISCIARAANAEEIAIEESSLVREIIGDIPLTGFFAGGEISNGRLYTSTSVLVLFF